MGPTACWTAQRPDRPRRSRGISPSAVRATPISTDSSTWSRAGIPRHDGSPVLRAAGDGLAIPARMLRRSVTDGMSRRFVPIGTTAPDGRIPATLSHIRRIGSTNVIPGRPRDAVPHIGVGRASSGRRRRPVPGVPHDPTTLGWEVRDENSTARREDHAGHRRARDLHARHGRMRRRGPADRVAGHRRRRSPREATSQARPDPGEHEAPSIDQVVRPSVNGGARMPDAPARPMPVSRAFTRSIHRHVHRPFSGGPPWSARPAQASL